jgi:hypothetical protein
MKSEKLWIKLKNKNKNKEYFERGRKTHQSINEKHIAKTQ